MFFKRVYDDDLAQASYILGCQKTGQALVIDPHRDADAFIHLANREGLQIVAVTETHIHADYLSGSRELAHRTQADLYASDEGGPQWRYLFDHIGLKDGSQIQIGNLCITAWHTPGHTPEHLSFVVSDTSRSPEPLMVLTGDFVFVGDLGRPDLLDEAAGGRDTRFVGAKQLFFSLKDKFLTLPDYVQVWPGHGSGSACGKALGALASTTVGYERRFSWWSKYIDTDDEAGFTRELLDGQPDAPLYFSRMKMQNKGTVRILGKVDPLSELSDHEVQDLLAKGARLLDSRSPEAFRSAAPKNSIHLPLGNTFETWAGWLLRPETSYILQVLDGQMAEHLRRRLWQVGVDSVVGFIQSLPNLPTETHFPKNRDALGDLGAHVVLDVRSTAEYTDGHIEGSRNIPASRLLWHLNELPKGQPILVYCQSGARSAVVASVLRAEGFETVELEGGYARYARKL